MKQTLEDKSSVFTFGKYLKKYRLEAKLTQKEVAEAFNLKSIQFVSNWERGLCDPPVEYFKTLSRLFHVPVKSLIKTYSECHLRRVRIQVLFSKPEEIREKKAA